MNGKTRPSPKEKPKNAFLDDEGGASLVACITSKYDFTEVGREFLADAFLTLTDSAGSGMPDIRNDIIGVAEV